MKRGRGLAVAIMQRAGLGQGPEPSVRGRRRRRPIDPEKERDMSSWLERFEGFQASWVFSGTAGADISDDDKNGHLACSISAAGPGNGNRFRPGVCLGGLRIVKEVLGPASPALGTAVAPTRDPRKPSAIQGGAYGAPRGTDECTAFSGAP